MTHPWLKQADDVIRQECQPNGHSFTDCSHKVAGWWWHYPVLHVKSHTISGAIWGNKSLAFWMAHKISIYCHNINFCLSANIHKGTPNLTSCIQCWMEWYCQKIPLWLQGISISMFTIAWKKMPQNPITYYMKLNDKSMAPSQYKDRLIYVWRFPC